ncbi:MAG TPA: formate dehydrogenase [Noviherbaspirillum sp.]|jgi:hypothetical protein|uniref:formate dehydrogenase n=1 Tax=Noviherbaspirillum sp. TaxID=1926288 RepID=UPI002DDDB324|nr:formate dehydrogenase [Noviherbaspirillum sp.]HEV2609059.1 formate dehydrogenase [Noviherbaspirillum sp.]
MPRSILDTKRRTLLAAAVCAPAVAVGALLSRQQPVAPQVSAAAESEPPSTGYHETEHIRKYYRSAAYI